MALGLAGLFGLRDEELVDVRRGSLLHDIGKMGVPDSILHKPESLTNEEWVKMRKHPTFAFEMLSPIQYLHGALDIPYCHHEKWDGSGYPRGLKGEQIPLVARIFAVVDEWDALTSDRPYRPAWTKEKAHEQIQAEAGTHFDPHIVEVFLASDILQAS
jgi:HD-GYP domain-containing protein (c-di-GMP phosphodiesterase class II)